MRDGDCQGVGGIVRFGDGIQLQQGAHHFLHLTFIGAAVAGDPSSFTVEVTNKGPGVALAPFAGRSRLAQRTLRPTGRQTKGKCS